MQEFAEGHKSVLQILAERESIFRLLPQTTAENLSKDFKGYAPNPLTRYPHVNKFLYSTVQMQGLYITDNEEHGDMPRNKYIKMKTHKPVNQAQTRLKLQQQTRSFSRNYSDDDEEDERICEIDKRIEMRKKMLAEEKEKQNDPSQYFTNRAKMLKDKGENSSPAQSSGSRRKTERLQAMAKISETFGYGEKVKKESPPLKKPLIPTEPRQKKKIQVKPKETREEPKPKPKQMTSGVKQWDFGAKSLPSKQKQNLDVDPELDGMLAQLESDTDFMKLSENEQIAWLESLFFLDTPSKAASSGLVKPKPRELSNGNHRRPTVNPVTKVDTNPISTTKSLSIQNSGNRKSAPKIEPKAETPPSSDETDNPTGGMSKDKMALAMSFFANDQKPAKKQPSKPLRQKKKETDSDDLPPVTNSTAKPFFRERAYYEPEEDELPEDDEDDYIPDFRARRATKQEPVEDSPPPIPARSGDNKSAMMLKLMKNATSIMRS